MFHFPFAQSRRLLDIKSSTIFPCSTLVQTLDWSQMRLAALDCTLWQYSSLSSSASKRIPVHCLLHIVHRSLHISVCIACCLLIVLQGKFLYTDCCILHLSQRRIVVMSQHVLLLAILLYGYDAWVSKYRWCHSANSKSCESFDVNIPRVEFKSKPTTSERWRCPTHSS